MGSSSNSFCSRLFLELPGTTRHQGSPYSPGAEKGEEAFALTVRAQGGKYGVKVSAAFGGHHLVACSFSGRSHRSRGRTFLVPLTTRSTPRVPHPPLRRVGTSSAVVAGRSVVSKSQGRF